MTPRKEIKILKAKLEAQERAIWELANFLETVEPLGLHSHLEARLDRQIQTAAQSTGLPAADRDATVARLKEVKRLLGLK